MEIDDVNLSYPAFVSGYSSDKKTKHNIKTEKEESSDIVEHNPELMLKTEDESIDINECSSKLILKIEDESEGINQHDTESNLKTEEEYEDPEKHNTESFIKTEDDDQIPSTSDTKFMVEPEDESLAADEYLGTKESDLAFDIKNEVQADSTIHHDPVAKVISPGKAKKAKQVFECDVCGKKVSRQWDLKIHKRIHSGERPYACSYCDQSFISNSHRKRHEIIHTKDNKPFKCEQCIRSFHSRTELEEHDFSHTGISKHCCDQCGSFFSNSSALKTHIGRVHDAQRNVPHNRASRVFKDSSVLACEKCGQLFKKKKKYDDHCNLHCYYKALEAIREQKFGLKKEPT